MGINRLEICAQVITRTASKSLLHRLRLTPAGFTALDVWLSHQGEVQLVSEPNQPAQPLATRWQCAGRAFGATAVQLANLLNRAPDTQLALVGAMSQERATPKSLPQPLFIIQQFSIINPEVLNAPSHEG